MLFDHAHRDLAPEVLAGREKIGIEIAEIGSETAFDVAAIGDARHAYVMFTSGTTGKPKGVAVTYDNVVSYIGAFAGIAPISPQDRCTQFFDLSFDLSVHDMFVAWANGAALCVPGKKDNIDPVGFAARARCTAWFSVPSLAQFSARTRRLKPGALPDLKLGLFCGEALPSSVAKQFALAAPGARVLNLYGPTEATIAITWHEFAAEDEGAMPPTVPLGRAYRDCAVVVAGEDMQPVLDGESGELLLGGRQLTDGYVNNPEQQAEKFIAATFEGLPYERWYRSGDLVRQDPRHGLVYLSRIDDQVKIQGYRIEILEVEEAMRAAAGSGEVAVVASYKDGASSAEHLVGFTTDGDADAASILDAMRRKLPAYMVPKVIRQVDALPLNANGKVDRKALRASLA